MQKWKFLFAAALLCIIIIAATAFYWYNKPRPNVDELKPVYEISATKLYRAFAENEKKANALYLNKIIQVKGIVDNVQSSDSHMNIILSAGNYVGGINCSISKLKSDVRPIPIKGADIIIKGRCVGFLMDVNLVDAIIEN